MAMIRPKNWAEFQHYKDRSPIWIKLHRSLLDNFEFHRLPVASRALAPMLWLLASEAENGIIDADPEKLAFRFRLTVSEIEISLNPLIENGFFDVVRQSASKTLASCKHDAMLEKRRKENKRETQVEIEKIVARKRANPKISLPDAFPDALSLEEASEYWRIQGRPDLCDRAADEAAQFRDHHSKNGTKFLDWPAAWRTWARNAIKFNRSPKHGPNQDNFAAGAAALIGEIRAERTGR